MIKEYKQMLVREIEINDGLVELLKEFMDDKWGDNAITAKFTLDDLLTGYEDYRCIMGLVYFTQKVEDQVRLVEKHKDQTAEENEN